MLRGGRVVSPGRGCAVHSSPVTVWQHKAGQPSASHPSSPARCSSAGAAPAPLASNLLVQPLSLLSPALLLSHPRAGRPCRSGLDPRPPGQSMALSVAVWGPPCSGCTLTTHRRKHTAGCPAWPGTPAAHQLLRSELQRSLAAALEENALSGKRLLEHASGFFVSITLKFIIR